MNWPNCCERIDRTVRIPIKIEVTKEKARSIVMKYLETHKIPKKPVVIYRESDGFYVTDFTFEHLYELAQL